MLLNFIAQLLIDATMFARTNWLNVFGGETPDAVATAICVTSDVGLLLKECLGDCSNHAANLQAAIRSE